MLYNIVAGLGQPPLRIRDISYGAAMRCPVTKVAV